MQCGLCSFIYHSNNALNPYNAECVQGRENRSLSFTNEVQSITILRVTRHLYQGIREEQIKILVLFSSHTDDDALNLKKINDPEAFFEGLFAITVLNDYSIRMIRHSKGQFQKSVSFVFDIIIKVLYLSDHQNNS